MQPQRLANLIDGQLQPASNGGWLDIHEPATGEVFGQCPDSDASDVERAVGAARAAAAGWASTPIEQRAAIMHRLADLVEAQQDAFAELESRDSGKPVKLARQVDIPRAVSNLRYFAAAIIATGSESHAMETGQPGSGAINYTLRQPLGVVGCISPVESAVVPVHLENRPRAGSGQYGGRQAIGSDALHGCPAWHVEHRGRLSPGRAQYRARSRPERGSGNRRAS